jgi:hypothetical protein
MNGVPPLPGHGEQSPQDRDDISTIFVVDARRELERDSRLQAGGKAWGAVVQQLKNIGEQRGWPHKSNDDIRFIGQQVAAEYENGELGTALGEAYHVGQVNFYENHKSDGELVRTITAVEEVLPVLRAIASSSPRPFAITSKSQRDRLQRLTGNGDLKEGDSSGTGFSLLH